MPGFIINGTGGPGPAHTVETRRKHRWAWSAMGLGGGSFSTEVLLLLKEASRPHPVFNRAELHHNQEQAYFAGKHYWEPIRLVWYDAEQPNDASKQVWDWVNSVCNISAVTLPRPNGYKVEGKLEMLDGAGGANETWAMYGCWPHDPNWGGLDYADTDIAQLEVTISVDRCVKTK